MGFEMLSKLTTVLMTSKNALRFEQSASCLSLVLMTTGQGWLNALRLRRGAFNCLKGQIQQATPHLPQVRNTNNVLQHPPANAPHSLDARATQAQAATKG